MKSKLLAATLFLAACGSKSAPQHTMPDQTPASTTTAATMPAATPAVATSHGKEKPEYGTYGFDTAGMDTKVKPGDSFYRYANGTWLDKTPIPADKSNSGMFTTSPFTRYLPGECGSVTAFTRRFSGRSFSHAHCA